MKEIDDHGCMKYEPAIWELLPVVVPGPRAMASQGADRPAAKMPPSVRNCDVTGLPADPAVKATAVESDAGFAPLLTAGAPARAAGVRTGPSHAHVIEPSVMSPMLYGVDVTSGVVMPPGSPAAEFPALTRAMN